MSAPPKKKNKTKKKFAALTKQLSQPQSQEKKTEMDGLTLFLEIVAQSRKTGFPTKWPQLNTALKLKTTKVKTPAPPELSAWNALDPSETYAGFMVLCAKKILSDNEKQTETFEALLAHLKLDESQLSNISEWLKFQQMFTFSGADVTRDDIEIEKNFFKNIFHIDITHIFNKMSTFEWRKSFGYDLGTGINWNLSDLAMVKYVTSQYDLCDTEKALTYRSMTVDKLNAFDTCILEAISKKNPQIKNAENAIKGFAAYKLDQLPKTMYQQIGKLELSTHDVQTDDGKLCENLFENRLLSYEDVANDQYLVGNPIFWDKVAKEWLSEKFNELNGESLGILMLYNMKSNDNSNSLEAFKKQILNCFRVTEFTNIDIEKFILLLEEFPPNKLTNNMTFSKDEMIAEIESFKSLDKNLDSSLTQNIETLLDCVKQDEQDANKKFNAGKNLPYLSTSILFIKQKEAVALQNPAGSESTSGTSSSASGSTSSSASIKAKKAVPKLTTAKEITDILTKISSKASGFTIESHNALLNKIYYLFETFRWYSLGIKNEPSKIVKMHAASTMSKLRILMNLIMANIENNEPLTVIKADCDNILKIAQAVFMKCDDDECTDAINRYDTDIKNYKHSNTKDPGASQFMSKCITNFKMVNEKLSLILEIQNKVTLNYSKSLVLNFIKEIYSYWQVAQNMSDQCYDNKRLDKIIEKIAESFTSCAKSYVEKTFKSETETYKRCITEDLSDMQKFIHVLQNSYA